MPMIWYNREAALSLAAAVRSAGRWIKRAARGVKNALGWLSIALILLVSIIAIVLLMTNRDKL